MAKLIFYGGGFLVLFMLACPCGKFSMEVPSFSGVFQEYRGHTKLFSRGPTISIGYFFKVVQPCFSVFVGFSMKVVGFKNSVGHWYNRLSKGSWWLKGVS